MTKIFRTFSLLTIALTGIGVVIVSFVLFKSRDSLPFLGEPGHVAGSFSFTNQNGQTITEKDISGKVQVVEYFFTTCPGICKQMNKNLFKVYQNFKSNNYVVILSHTVNPEDDSVEVLYDYAKKLDVTVPTWQFLTGDKERLYAMARQDYLLGLEDKSSGDEKDFIHTEFVALLDGQRRIRGFYDATNDSSVTKMMVDIKTLLKEVQ